MKIPEAVREQPAVLRYVGIDQCPLPNSASATTEIITMEKKNIVANVPAADLKIRNNIPEILL